MVGTKVAWDGGSYKIASREREMPTSGAAGETDWDANKGSRRGR